MWLNGITWSKFNDCKICKGEEWVCEDHPNNKWGYGDACCGGAGMPCVCNELYDVLNKGLITQYNGIKLFPNKKVSDE